MDGRERCINFRIERGHGMPFGIPDDLRDEVFSAQIHVVGDRLDTGQSLAGIVHLLGIGSGEVAVICAIEDWQG
jgi:hypothetical protein